jgi:hypothetical protein
MKLKEHGPEKAVLISIFLLRKLHKKKKSIVSFNLEILFCLFFFFWTLGCSGIQIIMPGSCPFE